MFIDYTKIKVISGKGGDGACTFRREKYVPKGGPDGGDGGRGGHVYIQADKQLSTLVDVHYKKTYRADSGKKGMGNNKYGKNAKDLTVKVPRGTLVKDKKTKKIIKDLIMHGDKITVARGGRGGRGNAHFKTSTRQAPRFYEKGEPGEEIEIVLELKILADAGIIGMANAGKSTLLSKISNAHPKIANYPFTTLTPVLGLVKIDAENSFVVADIPGLIEGASKGKGLGIEFLKHIERTRLHIHMIDATQGDVFANYRAINKELKSYSRRLLEVPRIVVINKTDLLKDGEVKGIKKFFSGKKIKVDFISAKENIGLEKLVNKVYNRLKKIPRVKETEGLVRVIEKDVLKLEKTEKGVYRLLGKTVERYVAMLDFESIEAIEVFRKYLKKQGIEVFLKQEGVKEGDVVVIGEKDFVYEEG